MDKYILFCAVIFMVGSIVNALTAAFIEGRRNRRLFQFHTAVALSPDYFRGKTMVVRVLPHAVENPHSWFRNHPGEAFEVKPIRNGYMLAQDMGPVIRCIRAEDCEVLSGKAA
jgi:hypothetical protein